jgi:hypothetical protein
MVAVVEISLPAFWSGIFGGTVGQKTFGAHLDNLVVLKIYTFQEIITQGSPEDLGLSSIMILKTLLMQSIIWMVKWFSAGQ